MNSLHPSTFAFRAGRTLNRTNRSVRHIRLLLPSSLCETTNTRVSVRFVTEIAIWDKGMTMTLPHHGA